MKKIVWGLILILISSNVTVGGFKPIHPLDILGVILLGLALKEIQVTDAFKLETMRKVQAVVVLLSISKLGLMFVDGGVYGWGIVIVLGVATQVLNLIALLLGTKILSAVRSAYRTLFSKKLLWWLILCHIVASFSVAMFLQAGQLYTDAGLKRLFLDLTLITAILIILIRIWAIMGVEEATRKIR